MSNCKYLSARKCCCCFNCDPRQVFLILSSTCLLLGLINMCSYPLCPAVIVSSLVLASYYFGCGIYLLYAITGIHSKLLRVFPWLMLISYIPIASYVGCLLYSLDCIEKWTYHYSIDENSKYAEDMFVGIISLYSMFAVVNFLFSTYALMLSLGQLEDKAGLMGIGLPSGQATYVTDDQSPYVISSGQPVYNVVTAQGQMSYDAEQAIYAPSNAPARGACASPKGPGLFREVSNAAEAENEIQTSASNDMVRDEKTDTCPSPSGTKDA